IRRLSAGRAGLALSRAEPARGPGLDRFLLGRLREQSSRALLQADAQRPPPASAGGRAVAAARERDRARDATRRGLTCADSSGADVSMSNARERCRRTSTISSTI